MGMSHLPIHGLVVKQIFNLISNRKWVDPCNLSNFLKAENRFFRELSQLTRLTGTARRDPVSRAMPACDSPENIILLFLQPEGRLVKGSASVRYNYGNKMEVTVAVRPKVNETSFETSKAGNV
jgi:hypothetical protein